MRVSAFLTEYELNHAGIEKVEYLQSQQSIIIHMELCNWMQKSYVEGQPGFVSGKLILSGVENFVATHSLNILQFNEHADGEIIGFGYVPECDKIGLEAGEIVMRWQDYHTHIAVVVILSFLAKDVEWSTII